MTDNTLIAYKVTVGAAVFFGSIFLIYLYIKAAAARRNGTKGGRPKKITKTNK